MRAELERNNGGYKRQKGEGRQTTIQIYIVRTVPQLLSDRERSHRPQERKLIRFIHSRLLSRWKRASLRVHVSITMHHSLDEAATGGCKNLETERPTTIRGKTGYDFRGATWNRDFSTARRWPPPSPVPAGRKNLFTSQENRDDDIRGLTTSSSIWSAGHSVQIAIYGTCSTCHWQRRRGQMQPRCCSIRVHGRCHLLLPGFVVRADRQTPTGVYARIRVTENLNRMSKRQRYERRARELFELSRSQSVPLLTINRDRDYDDQVAAQLRPRFHQSSRLEVFGSPGEVRGLFWGTWWTNLTLTIRKAIGAQWSQRISNSSILRVCMISRVIFTVLEPSHTR